LFPSHGAMIGARYSDAVQLWTFTVERHAPALAEHTDEILSELGFGPGEVEDLRARGVV